MITVERLLALFGFLSGMPTPNDEFGMMQQRHINELLLVLPESRFRIQRLVALAPSKGPAAFTAADKIFETVSKLTQTKTGNVEDLRREIDDFNHAVRRAHAEMLASRKPN